jgi:hypothetical protein
MKKYYSALFLLALILMGCSSTYTIKNFSSKEKFYQDFNNSVKERDIKVVLSNDSSFTLMHGAVLENDTLFAFGQYNEKKYMSLALSDLEKINYTGNDYKSATVLRNNGEELNCENIIINHDSIYFDRTKTVLTEENIASVNKIKTISYKNRLIRMPLGLLAGAPLGLLSGIILGHAFHTTDEKGNPDVTNITMAMTCVGALAGIIVSYIIGYDYIYQFNP